MTLFLIIATVLTALAIASLLVPLLRVRSGRDIDRVRANVGVLNDQLVELDADHARGAIGPEQYAEIRAEVERRVLDDVELAKAEPSAPARRQRAPAIALAILLPLGAIGFYSQLGDPAAFDPGLQAASRDPGDGHMSGAQLEQMVVSLRERLEREPDNAGGWATLAQSYYQMRRFSEAAGAFERLSKLIPDDPALLADYADALAMANGRNFEGKPRELIARALQIDPTQWKALAMAGTDAFEQKDYRLAVRHWEALRAQVPADSPLAQNLAGSIAEARSRAGMPAGAPSAPAPVARAQGQMPQDDVHKAARASRAADAGGAAASTTVGGTVSLAPVLLTRAAPTDRVFIYARPASGSRMPLAITSVQVKDLPARFTLDDSMGMSPDFKLSGQSEVIIGARVSKSGQPMPTSGDLEGASAPVKLGTRDASVMIDRVLP